jgi:hypothetical protein
MIATVIFCALLLTVVFHSFYNGSNIGTHYLWTSEQIKPNLSSRYNLAYGKKTAMNVRGDESNSSSLGVDGDRGGTFGFFTSDANWAWWYVDLGDEQNVSEVVVYKMKSGSRPTIPFKVRLSLDGKTASFGQTIKSEDAADAWHISVPGVEARYVGLRTLGPGLLHFSEVEVYK